MRHRHNTQGGFHNIILIVIIAVLALGLAGMLAYNHIESEKEAEELRKLAQAEKEKEDTQEEKLKNRYKAVQDAIDEYLPGIVCWGDSLTMGASGEGTIYPNVLSQLIKENVIDKFDLRMTPSSLLYDHIHFNATGYDLIGKLIYKRMDELGYFDEVQSTIENAMKPIE